MDMNLVEIITAAEKIFLGWGLIAFFAVLWGCQVLLTFGLDELLRRKYPDIYEDVAKSTFTNARAWWNAEYWRRRQFTKHGYKELNDRWVNRIIFGTKAINLVAALMAGGIVCLAVLKHLMVDGW